MIKIKQKVPDFSGKYHGKIQFNSIQKHFINNNDNCFTHQGTDIYPAFQRYNTREKKVDEIIHIDSNDTRRIFVPFPDITPPPPSASQSPLLLFSSLTRKVTPIYNLDTTGPISGDKSYRLINDTRKNEKRNEKRKNEKTDLN